MHFTTTFLAAVLSATALSAPTPLNTRQTQAQNSGNAAKGKRGVVYNDASIAEKFASVSSWGYNWDDSAGDLPSNIEYVPMLHSGNNINKFIQSATQSLSSGNVKSVLGFNEPDKPVDVGGSGMPDAAGAAKTFIDNVASMKSKGAKIGAPGVSAGGIDWLRQFAQACNGQCQVDFVPLHFYDYDHPTPEVQFESMKGWLTQTIPEVRQMFGNQNVEIWLTEFAFTPFTDAQNSAKYMDLALPWLDANDDIQRYSYFMAGADGNTKEARMTDANGQLTASGQRYLQM